MHHRKWLRSILIVLPVAAFIVDHRPKPRFEALNLFGGSLLGRIPTTLAEQNSLAITGIKAAIDRPKSVEFRFIECEFPPLSALNKLGDGSLRSSQEVDAANILFSQKLIQNLSPIPLLGPKIWFLTSVAASASFINRARKIGATLHSLRDGLPKVSTSDICILVSPSSPRDYEAARLLAKRCKAMIVVNGFAKDTKSIPTGATMAYYLKPLTYNSQVVGFLTRVYPYPWTTIDSVTKRVLASFDDEAILVKGTNTPDLRESGRLVQNASDQRAIQARRL